MKPTSNRKLAILLLLAIVIQLFAVSCTVTGKNETTTIAIGETTTASTGEITTTVSAGGDDNPDGIVEIDIFATNDFHGAVNDTASTAGIAKTSTYLKQQQAENDNTILISSGDMWQGSSESNNTKGSLVTDWMSQLGFASMTLGNHEFDWSTSEVKRNSELAEFPFLAINVYDRTTNSRVEYCQPSVTVECDGVTVGIIGAVGDVYSSISASMVEDVRFVVGDELTKLVKAEAEKLENAGADIIVYSIHDGYANNSTSGSTVTDNKISGFYDPSLSGEYIDLVFEGHTHSTNIYKDSKGVYHLQGGGNNKALSHVELTYDTETDSLSVDTAEMVYTSTMLSLADDPETLALFDKYATQIGDVYSTIGYNKEKREANVIKQLCADLYLKVGLEKWGQQYDIVLGGGFITCRSPYDLNAGEVCYADIQKLLPFDNNIVLCSVSGSKLLSQFINSKNSNYFICYGSYGNSVKSSINPNSRYYVITDTYSADYAPNGLTVVDIYDTSGTYARDLVAAYIAEGHYGKKPG